MQLHESTRLAIQASIAVMLAIIVSHSLNFERSYWAILTSMLLISQTWGESIKKSLERILMTILGGITGTLIYFLLIQHAHILVFILLLSVFFNIYFMGRNYLLVAFFTTMFVVFLFALVKDWTVVILEERIIETCIGGAIAIFTTALVLPMRAQVNIQKTLADHIGLLRDTVARVFDQALREMSDPNFKFIRNSLHRDFIKLRQKVSMINYEMVFTFYPRKKLRRIMLSLGTLMHYATSMLEMATELNQELANTKSLDHAFEVAHAINQNFDVLINHLNGKQKLSDESFISLTNLIHQMQQTMINHMCQQESIQQEWFDLVSFFYFAKKLNEVLQALIDLLEK